MLERIVNRISDKALASDVAKLDMSRRPSEITERLDISYIDDNESGHKFDVYLREDGKRKPILIDIHGGGFLTEDKAMTRLFGNFMALNGFTVFELNCRLAYPVCTVFDQIEDISRAVKFIREHADEFEGYADSLYVCGHSSGGVLAVTECLLSVDDKMREDFGLPAREYKYKGLIADCGLLHFYKPSIAYWGMRGMIFPKGYKKDKRYTYLKFEKNESISKLPKVALITNRKDVLRKMTYHFERVLKTNGTQYQLYDGGADGHTGIIFVPYEEHNQDTMKKITWYLQE